MPIYMDRHDVFESVTAKDVAQLHQEDLKVEQNFNCRGLTYWFDEKRKTAFCLVEAPNEQCIKDMHKHAHGEVPHVIIEVDAHIVESFLGRIQDPSSAQNIDLNIINDPAFRTIMVIKHKVLNLLNHNSLIKSTQNHQALPGKMVKEHEGRLVRQDENSLLVSFKSVSNAVNCAAAIQVKNKPTDSKTNTVYAIGLSAGLPVAGGKSLFEETIKTAERLCYVDKYKIVVTSEVRDLYQSENSNQFIKDKHAIALSRNDENFLNSLLDFMEKEWKNPDLKANDFNQPLGMSKSQLYRKMILLTGESPNTFIKEYRLNKALEFIDKKSTTISEVAFDTGFSSLSYFSKCFQKRFGLMPSSYLEAIK